MVVCGGAGCGVCRPLSPASTALTPCGLTHAVERTARPQGSAVCDIVVVFVGCWLSCIEEIINIA